MKIKTQLSFVKYRQEAKYNVQSLEFNEDIKINFWIFEVY